MEEKKQFIRYVIWGIITTLFHLGFFWLLNRVGLKYKIANVIAILSTKVLAYICNKFFVYRSKCDSMKELLKEMFNYIIARGFTFFIDFFLLIIFVDLIHLNKMISKAIVLGVVVIINYILGEKFVYKKSRAINS